MAATSNTTTLLLDDPKWLSCPVWQTALKRHAHDVMCKTSIATMAVCLETNCNQRISTSFSKKNGSNLKIGLFSQNDPLCRFVLTLTPSRIYYLLASKHTYVFIWSSLLVNTSHCHFETVVVLESKAWPSLSILLSVTAAVMMNRQTCFTAS